MFLTYIDVYQYSSVFMILKCLMVSWGYQNNPFGKPRVIGNVGTESAEL